MPLDRRIRTAAERLASLTGEDAAAAVATAVEEKLARLERDSERARRIGDLVALGLHCAENLTGPPITSEDVDTWLYDPYVGAPR